MINDIFGQPLAIGDTVAFNEPYYKSLLIGKILRFGKKKVTLEDPHPSLATWNLACQQTWERVKKLVEKP